MHVDHKLRNESSEDASFVKKFCQDRNIKFRCAAVDTLDYVNEKGFSIEEAARKLRYTALFSIAKDEKAQAVLCCA